MPIRSIRRVTERLRKLIAEADVPLAQPQPANPRLQVQGRLCMLGAKSLRARLFSLFEQPSRHLALDLARVRFMDGCALAVLIEFAQHCLHRGITLTLVAPSAQVWNTFSMYGMTEVLVQFTEEVSIDLDGALVVIEEDFPDSIRLPAIAA
jgi:anti-anti-sigma factor